MSHKFDVVKSAERLREVFGKAGEWWIQGDWKIEKPRHYCYCLSGGVNAVCRNDDRRSAMRALLNDAIKGTQGKISVGEDTIMHWNDMTNRKVGDVIKILDRAVAFAKKNPERYNKIANDTSLESYTGQW